MAKDFPLARKNLWQLHFKTSHFGAGDKNDSIGSAARSRQRDNPTFANGRCADSSTDGNGRLSVGQSICGMVSFMGGTVVLLTTQTVAPLAAIGCELSDIPHHRKQALAFRGEVAKLFAGFCVIDHGSHRNPENAILALAARAIAAGAVLAPLCAMSRLEPKVHQSIQAVGCSQQDAAAIAAIAPVRAAQRDVFLTAEAHATVAAVTGFHPNFCFVDKFHGCNKKSPVMDEAFLANGRLQYSVRVVPLRPEPR